jgi:hypothetical protein
MGLGELFTPMRRAFALLMIADGGFYFFLSCIVFSSC